MLDSEAGVKNHIFELIKKVVEIDSESIFRGFMMTILTNLTSDFALDSVNEPKLQKSTIIFSDLRISRFAI